MNQLQHDSDLPYGVDASTPSVARMYDHLLDGRDNFACDRQACEELLRHVPSMKALALNNRAFLRRAVHTLASEYGIRQFIDHGSGLPTRENVHEVAQNVDPECRVVYVDYDPIVHNVGGVLLQANANTAVLQADMRHTDEIFASAPVKRLIRPDEPVAALFVSVLHCIPDEEDSPLDLLARVRQQLPPGSFMVVCQLVSEDQAVRDFVTDFMLEQTGDHWGRVRRRQDVERYFDGLEVVAPGLMEVSQWRQESDGLPQQATFEWEEYGGLGRLP